jgi:hypothetical protein
MAILKKIGIFMCFVGLFGCLTKPDFPFAPIIEYANLIKKPDVQVSTGATLSDSVFISVTFRDGNGDIGLDSDNPQDIVAPYQPLKEPITPDSLSNPNYFNFHCYVLAKRNGKYERVIKVLNRNGRTIRDTFWLCGRVPRLLTNNKLNPLDGTILFRTSIPYIIDDAGINFNINDSVKFEVFVKDRALNNSNTIITPAILIRQQF